MPQLRLLVVIGTAATEAGGQPSTAAVHELLDERLELHSCFWKLLRAWTIAACVFGVNASTESRPVWTTLSQPTTSVDYPRAQIAHR